MKRAVFTLLILVLVGGFAFAVGDKEEIGATAGPAVAAAEIAVEETADNLLLPMDSPIMVVANTANYNIIDILDDRKKLIV